MEQPQISVIIPGYNCSATIGTALDSVLEQGMRVEIIVINDCSRDDLDAVMARYAHLPQIIYVKNETNLGAAGSRNKGVAMARGEYVAFLDSDDYWAPNKLKMQFELLRKTGCVLCCTARELMTPEGVCTGRVIPVKSTINYRDLLRHNSINCSSVLIRREAALAVPMEHEDSHEDYITWLKVLREYGPAVGINEPLLKYRLSNTGKSGNKLKSARMTFLAYRYLGYGMGMSLVCFCSYALHGVGKYLRSYCTVNRKKAGS